MIHEGDVGRMQKGERLVLAKSKEGLSIMDDIRVGDILEYLNETWQGRDLWLRCVAVSGASIGCIWWYPITHLDHVDISSRPALWPPHKTVDRDH